MSIEKAYENLSINALPSIRLRCCCNALPSITKLASKGVYTGFDLEEDSQ